MPSAVAFLALGDVVAGALYQSGAFTRGMTLYVWGILAGSAVGLLASTMGRLYASTYYALHDTRTPLRFAVLRVALTIGLGYLFALPLPRAARAGPALGRGGTHRVGRHGGVGRVRAAPARAQRADRRDRAAGRARRAALGRRRRRQPARPGRSGSRSASAHPMLAALVLLSVYGAVYFFITDRLGIPEARAVMRRLRPREPGPGRRVERSATDTP